MALRIDSGIDMMRWNLHFNDDFCKTKDYGSPLKEYMCYFKLITKIFYSMKYANMQIS